MFDSVTCIARGKSGSWEAICIDFDIAVTGRSFQEVRGLLESAVRSYVADAMAEPDVASRATLLRRKTPFFARLRWTWPFVLTGLFGSK